MNVKNTLRVEDFLSLEYNPYIRNVDTKSFKKITSQTYSVGGRRVRVAPVFPGLASQRDTRPGVSSTALAAAPAGPRCCPRRCPRPHRSRCSLPLRSPRSRPRCSRRPAALTRVVGAEWVLDAAEL